jgi:kinesin family protein C1
VAKLGPSADQDKKSRELMKESAEYENGPAVKALNDQLFAVGRGLSDNELRRLIENKMPVAMSMQQSEAIITKLKDTLSDVLKAKNALLSGAVDAEKKAREGWGRSLKSAAAIDEDRAAVKSKVKQLEADRTIWKDNAKDSMRELGVAEEKVQALVHELRSVKEKLATTDKSKTEALIAMEVGKAKNWAVQKEIDTLKQELVALEKSNAKAVEKAKSGASEGHLTKLKEESKSQKARIKELEAEVKRKDMEAQKSVVEKDAAVEKASAKDRDLSELMKSLGDIQRSGMEREETANKKRQEAEAQVTGLERSLVDTKGELTVLKHEKASIAEGLEKAKKDLDAAETSLKGIREQVDGYKSEISSQAADLKLEKELRTRSELKEVEERNERIAVGAQMVAMTKEHAVMQQQLNEANEVLEVKWRKKMEEKEAMVEAREAELVEAQDLITGLEGEIGSLKEALTHQKSAEAAQHAETVSKLNGEIHLLNAKIKAEEEKLPAARAEFAKERLELENQIREGAAERRRMHNTIQELRGNVRVFARIRPFLPTDDVADNEMPCVIPKSDTELKLTTDGDERKATPFTFDRVFGPVSSQEAVFIEVAEFVQSALDGYNVTLFSYGQTGSGKTHTMQGSGLGQMRGIIPRAIEQVGEYKNELEAQGWKYEMQVSFLEIYNESIRDLLRGDDEDIGDKKHEIKVKSDGTRFVTDLTVKPLEPTDMEAVGDVMSTAAKFRTTKATSMNDVSSRSHSVFTLHLTAVHPETNKSLKGMLNLVDLAGSERIKRSGVTGDEAKEAVAINKSLSSLTNVFVSIGGKAGHIPFRNSKLTYLLQPSLSGDGKTLMIANLSPTEMSAPESLSSLRFASDVNKCELGQAKSSVQEINSDDEDDTKSTSSRGGRPGTSPKRTPPSSRSSSRGSASSVSSRGSTTRRTTPTARKTPPGRTPTKGTPSGRTSAPAGRTGRIPRPSSASKTPGNAGSRPAARKS